MTDSLETELKGLMLLALQGNATAYEEFLNRTSVVLRSFLGMVLGPRKRSPERIEDLIQEVLLAIHRKRDLYKPEMPILPWIHAIARYRFIDQLRKEKRSPQTVEWDVSFEALWVSLPHEHAPDSGEHLLEGLTDRQKEVIRLAKIEELPLAQIAKRLDMSLSSVKVTIHRAIHAIKKKHTGYPGSK